MLRVRLLGAAVVEGENGPLGGAAGQRKSLAVLGLLGAAGDRGMSRDRILAYVWPEVGLEKGSHRLTQVLYALRRELVSSNELFVRERGGEFRGKPASWVAIGDAEHIGGLETATSESLATFDEWRGGCGLSLAVSRRIIDGHGGAMWSPAESTKAGAVVALPRS